MRMDHRRLYAFLAVLPFVLISTVNSVDPSTTTDCFKHTKMKHIASKPGCQDQVIYVHGCWGRCNSNEIPELEPPYTAAFHPMCYYDTYTTATKTLSNCANGVDPTYTYINAVTCVCKAPSSSESAYAYRPDNYV
ncbi:glycoprotein hormone beta-5-like [Antedon mediterranea]|uniref:glycoprotein hormone beta-5-like n=1 Tax=Antedon mediterranea TaxID=105859 RepID=UPI003AF603F5